MQDIQYTAYLSNNNPVQTPKVVNFEDIPILGSKKPVTVNPLPISKPQEEVVVAQLPTESVIKGITDNSKKYNIGNMQHVIDAFEKAGISIRVTSGLRPGAMTKQGNKSHHSVGNALDITPNFAQGETWDSMRNKIRASKELQNYLIKNNIGILDETTPQMLAQTGGTGAHWHIGPDKKAVEGLRALISRNGSKLLQLGGQIQYSPYMSSVKTEVPKKTEFQAITKKERIPGQYVRQYDLSDKPRSKDSGFDTWYKHVASTLGLNPNPDDPNHHYDYRGFYDEVVVPSGNQYAVIPQGYHFPDAYKLPGHETFSVESKYYKPGMSAGHWNGEDYVPTPFEENEMEARQQWAETRFKKGRVSSAGARGAYQFMPKTWNWLNEKFKVNLNIDDYNDNKRMRDLYMNDLMNNELIKSAKGIYKNALAYAAYNWGIGNLRDFIKRQKNKNVDVYNTLDWIDDLPTETKNYVNFIVRGIDGKGDLTTDAFNKALPNRYKEFPEVKI